MKTAFFTRNIIGDWSDDGHGKTEVFFYRIEGEGTVDEIKQAMKEAFDRNCRELGVDLGKFMSRYLDSLSGYPNEVKALAAAGLLQLPEDWDVAISSYEMSTIIMELSTRGTSISWEEVELTTLVGGYDSTLLRTVGYGLFD